MLDWGCIIYPLFLYKNVDIFEISFKSIAMDTDFLIDIIYHRVIGYFR